MENQTEELLQIKEMVAAVSKRISAMREAVFKKFSNGVSPETATMQAIADAMIEVADLVGESLVSSRWKNIYARIGTACFSEELYEHMVLWERSIDEWIDMIESQYRVCNICGHTVMYQPGTDYFKQKQQRAGFPFYNATFESISKRYRTCPVCGSMDRERMIAMFVQMLRPEEESHDKLKVLQIAPSYALDNYLRSVDYIDYETTDLYMENVTFRSDIQNMDMVESETYDIIICSHILEHVEDDRKAMQELKRILKQRGVCIFLVPLVIGSNRMDEEYGLPEEENWKRFGQNDHARLYSKKEFLNRLTQTGYLVHILGREYFGNEAWEDAGLSDIHCLYAATKEDIGIGREPYRIVEETEELVSVIIPAYNRGYCISGSIQSVLNQTWENLEVIVVDDGSTDDTEQVVSSFKDARVHYVKLEKNGGANHARNVGIKQAKGEYIAFNDSDDEWLPEKLEKQMQLFHLQEQIEGKTLGGIYCAATKYQNGQIADAASSEESFGEDITGDIYRFMWTHMFIALPTIVLKKKLLEEVGGFNESLERAQDWELFLRIAEEHTFYPVQESLVNVYIQEDCISLNVRGFVDTVMYAIRYHHIDRISRRDYESLIGSLVAYMKSASLPKDYYECFVNRIVEDQVLLPLQIREIRNNLGLIS